MTTADDVIFELLTDYSPARAPDWPADVRDEPALAWLRDGVVLWHELRRGAPLDAAAASARLRGELSLAALTPDRFAAQVGELAAVDGDVGSLCGLLSMLLSTRAAVPPALAEAARAGAAQLARRALEEAGPGEGAALAVRLARLEEARGDDVAARVAWRAAVERDPLVAWALPEEAAVQVAARAATKGATGSEQRLRRAIDALARGDRSEASRLLGGLVGDEPPRAEAVFLLALEHVREAAAARPRSTEATSALARGEALLAVLPGTNPAIGLLRAVAALVALDRTGAITRLDGELTRLTGRPAEPGAAAELVAALTELVRRPPHDLAAILRAAYFEGLLDPALALEVPRGPLASFRKLVIGLSLVSALGTSGSALAMMAPAPELDAGAKAAGAAAHYVLVDKADDGNSAPYAKWLVPLVARSAAGDTAEEPASAEVAGDLAAAHTVAGGSEVRFVDGEGDRADRRQISEGYWLSQMITAADVPGLQADGVRVVLSAVRPEPETLAALEAAGIEQVNIRMGATFRHADVIREVAARYAPEEILVHCTHGADRTGSIAAFLLVEQHGWSVPDAFYAVVYPSEAHVEGLAYALQRMGYDDVRTLEDPSVGFYSPGGRDVGGGLKAHNEAFREIIYTAIDAIQAAAE